MIAAPGPSLTPDVAERCRTYTVLAVKEGYRLLPWAEVLYGCDAKFWDRNEGCRDFKGERWSSHGSNGIDDKLDATAKYGLHLVRGAGKPGFSLNSTTIHYGGSSGFQAINLAILFGATYIVLVGFDMRVRDGRRYFFGDHPNRTRPAYADSIWKWNWAAKRLPPHIRIMNATPKSALTCFPMVDLANALTA